MKTASDMVAALRTSSPHLAVLLGAFLFGQGVEREPRMPLVEAPGSKKRDSELEARMADAVGTARSRDQ